MAIWDDVIPEEERQRFADKGWASGDLPHGTRPAVLVVDLSLIHISEPTRPY